eukprot:3460350-Rhodomonas_salina.1
MELVGAMGLQSPGEVDGRHIQVQPSYPYKPPARTILPVQTPTRTTPLLVYTPGTAVPYSKDALRTDVLHSRYREAYGATLAVPRAVLRYRMVLAQVRVDGSRVMSYAEIFPPLEDGTLPLLAPYASTLRFCHPTLLLSMFGTEIGYGATHYSARASWYWALRPCAVPKAAMALRSEIRYKKPHTWYKLYGDRAHGATQATELGYGAMITCATEPGRVPTWYCPRAPPTAMGCHGPR